MTKSKTQERIDLYKFQLDTLLKFTEAVSANASDEELLNLYCNVLKDNLTIDKLVIFLKTKDEGWKVIANYGTSQEDYQDLDIDNDFADINSYETNLHIKIPKLHQFECVIPIYMDNQKICYVLMADTQEREGISPTIKHVRYLQILTSFIISSIEKRRLAQENLEQAILKGEIDSASKIQQQPLNDFDKLVDVIEVTNKKLDDTNKRMDAIEEKISSTDDLKSSIEFLVAQVQIANEKIAENKTLNKKIDKMEKQLQQLLACIEEDE